MKLQENQKLHKGIFSFLSKQSLTVSGMRKILEMYGATKDMKRPKKNRLEWYSEVSHVAQGDFANFKKFYNKNKENLQYSQSYDDWWNECNLDGSFAYNGVTDDF